MVSPLLRGDLAAHNVTHMVRGANQLHVVFTHCRMNVDRLGGVSSRRL